MEDAVELVTIDAETADDGATLAFLDGSGAALADADADADADGWQVRLGASATTIQVRVTAEDATTLTYTLAVIVSDNSVASLRSLSLSGVAFSPAFSPGVTSYTASVADTVSSTTVTATTSQTTAMAVVKLNGVTDADAMEDAHATLQEDSGNLEADLERAFEDSLEDMGDRLASLAEDSWSDEDAELASEFAETLVRAFTDVFEGMFGVLGDYGDEISSLRPPAHLAELHNTLTEGIEEFVREGRELVEDLKDIDTDIDSEEELGDFWASLGSIGDSDLGPGEQVEEACRELRAKLEAELGTNVNICE